VRFPVSGELKKLEDAATPRAGPWTRLLKDTGAPGIYFEDYPELAASSARSGRTSPRRIRSNLPVASFPICARPSAAAGRLRPRQHRPRFEGGRRHPPIGSACDQVSVIDEAHAAETAGPDQVPLFRGERSWIAIFRLEESNHPLGRATSCDFQFTLTFP